MLLIFDFDGTLADTWDWFVDELVDGAQALGYPAVSRADVEALRGRETRDLLQSLGIEGERLVALAGRVRQRAEQACDGFRLFDGIGALVADLHARGHTLALVSSNSDRAVRATLGEDMSSRFVARRCGAGVFDKAKAFASIVEETGARREETIAIGDETRDLDAAAEAEIDAFAVEWGFADAALLRRKAPERTASTPDMLADLIEKHATRNPA